MVVGVGARDGYRIGVVDVLYIQAIGQIGGQFPPVLDAHAPVQVANSRFDVPALGLYRFSGNDVDDAVHGVGAPQSRAGAADDLDPVDVLHGNRLHVPVDAGKQRCVDAAPIDQDQELVVEALVRRIAAETARGDDVAGRADLRHLQVGREAKDFREARGA